MKKILIIEDQEDILDDLKTLLQFEGFKVYTATNGENGVIIAKSYLPDLIISDIMLPGIDGYEVFTTLNENESTSHIPFIFLTAKVEKHDLRKGMGLGADDYIFKPYDVIDLLSAVNTRLNKYDKMKEKIIHTLKTTPIHNSNSQLSENESIFITTNRATIQVNLQDIIFIRAENQYSNILCVNNKSYLIRKALSDWQNILPGAIFLRVHRTTIINKKYFLSMKKNNDNNYEIVLTDVKEPVEVSRGRVKELKGLLLMK